MKQPFRENFAWMTISRVFAWTGSGVLAPTPIIIMIVGIGLQHHESTVNTE